MATLKRKNANGDWELLQLTGEDMTSLKSDVENHTSQLTDIAINPKANGATGGGILEDNVAIQNTLNNAQGKKVRFPDGTFLLGATVRIPSNIEIEFSKNCTIKAKNGLNAPLFDNDTVNGNVNISINGGIFDGDGINQTNSTTAFKLKKINGFKFKNVTIKSTYGLGTNFGDIQNYEIENIHFEQDGLSPNQDGIHISGPSSQGYIKNISGTTHDDIVALNADDQSGAWSTGDITNILIDNIQSDNCYRAVRLLSVTSLIDDITINNINCNASAGLFEIGTFGVAGGSGNIGTVTINNVKGIPDSTNGFFTIDGNINKLILNNVIRDDDKPSPFLNLATSYSIGELILDNIIIKEKYATGATQFILDGSIDTLLVNSLSCEKVSSTLRNFLLRGTITNLIAKNIEQTNGKRLFELSSSAVVKNILLDNTSVKDVENLLYSESAIELFSLSNVSVDGGNIPIQFYGTGAGGRVKVNNFETKNTAQGGRDANKKDLYFSGATGNISVDGDITLDVLPNAPKLWDSFIYTGNSVLSRGKVIWNGTNFVNILDNTVNA